MPFLDSSAGFHYLQVPYQIPADTRAPFQGGFAISGKYPRGSLLDFLPGRPVNYGDGTSHRRILPTIMCFTARDFIATPEGLIFAVVDGGTEEGRVLSWLRYVRENGGYRKLATAEAEAHLAARAPGYRYRSKRSDALLHGIPLDRIVRHYRPRERVRGLLRDGARDPIEEKALRWLRIVSGKGLDPARIGLTGSLLIGAQTADSDLDFVVYGREFFFEARRIVRVSMEEGELAVPDEAAWRDAYARRGCALDFAEYVWHERRKFNKGLCAGTKFDISLIAEDSPATAGPVRKLGSRLVRARVADARYAFDNPARYRLEHPEIAEALSFTQTYAGQAEAGEWVELAGILEAAPSGLRQIVVGTSREAPGEYIKVLRGTG